MKETALAVFRGVGRFVLLLAVLAAILAASYFWTEWVLREGFAAIALSVLVGIGLRVLFAFIGWELDELERKRRARP